MTVPPAFAEEPFASLSHGRDLLLHEVLDILRITPSEFAVLRTNGYLKRSGTMCFASYNRKKTVAFAYGLHSNARHAETIASLIGRRDPAWA